MECEHLSKWRWQYHRLSGTYKRGTNITFIATEGTGYLFTGWYGDLLSDPINMSLSTNVLISTNLSIVGTFSGDADGDGLLTEENALDQTHGY